MKPLHILKYSAISSSFWGATAAFAETDVPAGQSPIVSIAMLIFIAIIFYLLLVRPQQKKVKEHRKMITEISIGDEIITRGGLVGQIVEIRESVFVLEVGVNSQKNQLRLQKNSLEAILPKGTIEKL